MFTLQFSANWLFGAMNSRQFQPVDAASSTNQQFLPAPDTQRCCYPSKRCNNPRVLKRNGELHRLCEYHRTKANVNQRRLEQRRRLRSMESESSGSNQDEDRSSQRLSLPDLSTAGASDLELDVLDEFLAQADIELSPVSLGSNPYIRDFLDSSSDVRMSI